MQAEITVNSQAEAYARRIALVGSLKRMARKCAVIEVAIARDLEKRRERGESPTPLCREVAR